MSNQTNTNKNQRLVTGLKWGLGGLIAWNLLRPEARDGIREFLSNEIAAYNQQQAEIERQKRIQEIWANFSSRLGASPTTPTSASNSPTSLTKIDKPKEIILSSPTISSLKLLTDQHLESDKAWRKKIVHPSEILILGKRGSGKSALGYRLLELRQYCVPMVDLLVQFAGAMGQL